MSLFLHRCDHFRQQEIELILCAMKQLEEVTAPCIKFRPAQKGDLDWVLILRKDDKRCFSGIGYEGPGKKEHEINLGKSKAICVVSSTKCFFFI